MSMQDTATKDARNTHVFRSPRKALAMACKSARNGLQVAASRRRPRRTDWPECADARTEARCESTGVATSTCRTRWADFAQGERS
eukprot:7287242-Alexandrium_andersonii.AAC.1